MYKILFFKNKLLKSRKENMSLNVSPEIVKISQGSQTNQEYISKITLDTSFLRNNRKYITRFPDDSIYELSLSKFESMNIDGRVTTQPLYNLKRTVGVDENEPWVKRPKPIYRSTIEEKLDNSNADLSSELKTLKMLSDSPFSVRNKTN